MEDGADRLLMLTDQGIREKRISRMAASYFVRATGNAFGIIRWSTSLHLVRS